MAGWRAAALVVVASGLVLGCGGGEPEGGASSAAETEAPGATAGEAGGGSLTAEEMENGVGPVRGVVELGELDEAMAERGEALFETRCYACHRLGERYVAPKLGDVLERRTPTYVMNMILNPSGMTERHPTARGLLAEFMTQMPNQGLTQEEARAVVEYIRSEAAAGGEGTDDNDPSGR